MRIKVQLLYHAKKRHPTKQEVGEDGLSSIKARRSKAASPQPYMLGRLSRTELKSIQLCGKIQSLYLEMSLLYYLHMVSIDYK